MAVVNPLQPVEMAPQISPQVLLSASSRDKAMLRDILELLNKLFVRNVNQHRRNHWWKSLHAFRKQLGLLLNELETAKKTVRAEKIEQRLRYWDEKCIHQWYLYVKSPFIVIIRFHLDRTDIYSKGISRNSSLWALSAWLDWS